MTPASLTAGTTVNCFCDHRLIVLFVDQRIVGTAEDKTAEKDFKPLPGSVTLISMVPRPTVSLSGVILIGRLVPFEAGHGKVTGGDQDDDEND